MSNNEEDTGVKSDVLITPADGDWLLHQAIDEENATIKAAIRLVLLIFLLSFASIYLNLGANQIELNFLLTSVEVTRSFFSRFVLLCGVLTLTFIALAMVMSHSSVTDAASLGAARGSGKCQLYLDWYEGGYTALSHTVENTAVKLVFSLIALAVISAVGTFIYGLFI